MCRKCDGTEVEGPDPQIAAAAALAPAAGPPAATFSRQGQAAPAVHQQPPYPPAMAGPSPQQEYRAYQEYQPPPTATPMQMQAQAAHQPQVYQGGDAGGYSAMHAVQYEWPGPTVQPMGQVVPGAQYLQQAGMGQHPHQVVYAQPGAHMVGGTAVYGNQYLQQGQPIAYAGTQYPGGQPVMYHYAQQAGPAAGEQPGRMY